MKRCSECEARLDPVYSRFVMLTDLLTQSKEEVLPTLLCSWDCVESFAAKRSRGMDQRASVRPGLVMGTLGPKGSRSV